MTPTTASGSRRRASGDGEPLDDGQEPSSPMEGTSSILGGAAADAARVATAPVRLPVKIAARVARPLASAGLTLAGRLADRLLGGDDGQAPARRSADPERRRESDAAAVAEARRHGARAAAAPPPAASAPPAPVTPPPPAPTHPEHEHLDEAAVPVAEFAERGAEDGAGAEVAVSEPWDGYDDQPAAEIVRRLRGASREELAAVQLYEGFGRKRRTVIEAAERGLRKADAEA